MIQAVNKSGVLMGEVKKIADYFIDMQEMGEFYDEDDAFFMEEDCAKEIVYAVRCWITQKYDDPDDKTLKEFVGILLGQRL